MSLSNPDFFDEENKRYLDDASENSDQDWLADLCDLDRSTFNAEFANCYNYFAEQNVHSMWNILCSTNARCRQSGLEEEEVVNDLFLRICDKKELLLYKFIIYHSSSSLKLQLSYDAECWCWSWIYKSIRQIGEKAYKNKRKILNILKDYKVEVEVEDAPYDRLELVNQTDIFKLSKIFSHTIDDDSDPYELQVAAYKRREQLFTPNVQEYGIIENTEESTSGVDDASWRFYRHFTSLREYVNGAFPKTTKRC